MMGKSLEWTTRWAALVLIAVIGCAKAAPGEGVETASTETGNPPSIDAALIEVTKDADGVVIVGEPGAVTPGDIEVEITTPDGTVVTVQVEEDGSFRVELRESDEPRDTYSVVAIGGDDRESETVTLSVDEDAPDAGDDTSERGGDDTSERGGDDTSERGGEDTSDRGDDPDDGRELGCSRPSRPIDKIDLLLVVDDSNSMQEEQASLRREFPQFIRTLSSGVGSDGSEFPPIKDMHLGVVSSDMGLPRVDGVRGCVGFGKDGIMNSVPDEGLPECGSARLGAPFLSYRASEDSADEIATDLGCIASLGTEGCGYEQQLEAALKALWPAVDIDPETGEQWVNPATGMPGNRITFLDDGTGAGRTGHGDGLNDGFLRSDSEEGASLLAIVVVTDEEDCSSSTTDHFVPARNLPPGSPYEGQGQNLRCFFNRDTGLHQVQRYIDGFKALRPGNEELVIFATIAGVPVDLATDAYAGDVDWGDDSEREDFYEMVLGDPRMQHRIDPSTQEDGNIDTYNLVPSCRGDGGANSKAYPPRRLVEVARGFGENGSIHSICGETFEPALGGIANVITRRLQSACPLD